VRAQVQKLGVQELQCQAWGGGADALEACARALLELDPTFITVRVCVCVCVCVCEATHLDAGAATWADALARVQREQPHAPVTTRRHTTTNTTTRVCVCACVSGSGQAAVHDARADCGGCGAAHGPPGLCHHHRRAVVCARACGCALALPLAQPLEC
jgi:hypothetical protein